jgi:thermolysin
MRVRLWSGLVAVAGLSSLVVTTSVSAQTLRSAATLWASSPAEVPALAAEVDAMLRRGDLVFSTTQRDSQFPGRSHERLDQHYRGVRVFGGQMVWQKDGGLVLSVTGNLFQDISLDVAPSIGREAAISAALVGGEPGARQAGTVELVVLPLPGRFALAYYMHLRGRGTVEAVFVDAHSGGVLLRYNDLRTQEVVGRGIGTFGDEKKVTIQEAAGTHRAVDTIRPFGITTYDVRFNFDTWNTYRAATDAFIATDADNLWEDGAVVDAHAYAGYTYDYYFRSHGRRGINDRDLAAINFVHILPQSAGFQNAFYDPVDNSLNYGDGDGISTTYFSAALDVVAHELTHAFTEFTSNLIYLNESGALNEAISDVMATAVEFAVEPPGSGRLRAEWHLGEDIFVNFGPIIRSIENPRSVGDPDHYDVRCLPPICTTSFDNGGVHINSSIANHAFYLMVEGGTNRTSGITVEGIGRDQMDRIESIFYRAFFFFLVPSSNYSNAREATIRAAQELYGAGSREEQIVRDGWRAVGVE